MSTALIKKREVLPQLQSKIYKLREMLYTTMKLSQETEENAASLIQNMDIKLSPGVKKGGVNIIQMQSVQINKVTINLIDILHLIDKLSCDIDDLVNNTPPKTVEEVEGDILKQKLIEGSMPMKDFMRLAKRLYINNLLRKSKSKTEAAKKLGIQRTYLSRMLSNEKNDSEVIEPEIINTET